MSPMTGLHRALLVLMVLAGLAVSPMRAAAPPTRQRERALLSKAIHDHLAAGRFDRAIRDTRRLLVLEAGDGVPESTRFLAELEEAADNLPAACRLFLLDEARRTRSFGADDLRTARARQRAKSAALLARLPAADRQTFCAGLRLGIQANFREDKEGTDKAIPLFRQAIQTLRPVVGRHRAMSAHLMWGVVNYNLGIALRDRKPDAAGKLLDDAVACFTAGLPGRRLFLAEAFHCRAIWHNKRRENPLAVADYTRAIEQFEQFAPDSRPTAYAVCLINRSVAKQNLDGPRHALADMDSAIAFLDGPPVRDAGLLVQALLRRSELRSAVWAWQDAQADARRAIAFVPAKHPLRPRLDNALGLVLHRQSRDEEARKQFDLAVERERELLKQDRRRSRMSLANYLNNRGLAEAILGRVAAALRDFDEAIACLGPQELIDPNRDGGLYLRCLINRGYLLTKQWDLLLARQDLELAVRRGRASLPASRAQLAVALGSLGVVKYSQGDLEKGIRNTVEAIQLALEKDPRTGKVVAGPEAVLPMQTLLEMLAGRYTPAAKVMRYARGLRRLVVNTFPDDSFPTGMRLRLQASLCLLNVSLRQQDYPAFLAEARAIYPYALKCVRFAGLGAASRDCLDVLYRVALAFHLSGNHDRARDLVHVTASALLKWSQRLLASASDAALLRLGDWSQAQIDLLLSIQAHTGKADPVSYGHLWQLKTLATHLLILRRERLFAKDANVQALQQKREQYRRELDFLGPLVTGDRREKTILELERVEHDLAMSLRFSEGEMPVGPDGPRRLTAELPEGVCVLDFYRYTHSTPKRIEGKLHYAVYVLMSGRPPRWVDLGPAQGIEESLMTFGKQVLGGEIPDAGNDLRRSLWDALELPVESSKVVLIAPSGPLALLPWSALPSKKGGRWLIEDHAIALLPHPAFLLGWRQRCRTPIPETLLAVVDETLSPAAGSKGAGELDFLRVHAGKRLVPLVSQEATARKTLEQLGKVQAAVFCVHGEFNRPPPRSVNVAVGLVGGLHPLDSVVWSHPLVWRENSGELPWFEPDRTIPRFVTVGDRYPLANCQLVMPANAGRAPAERDRLRGVVVSAQQLSHVLAVLLLACHQGKGSVLPGEGVFDMQRAFHLAGVRSTIANLWEASGEQTPILFNDFTRAWLVRGQAPLSALWQAQLAYLAAKSQEADGGSPLFWGGWVHSGDPGDLEVLVAQVEQQRRDRADGQTSETDRGNYWLPVVLGSVALLALALAWVFWRR